MTVAFNDTPHKRVLLMVYFAGARRYLELKAKTRPRPRNLGGYPEAVIPTFQKFAIRRTWRLPISMRASNSLIGVGYFRFDSDPATNS